MNLYRDKHEGPSLSHSHGKPEMSHAELYDALYAVNEVTIRERARLTA